MAYLNIFYWNEEKPVPLLAASFLAADDSRRLPHTRLPISYEPAVFLRRGNKMRPRATFSVLSTQHLTSAATWALITLQMPGLIKNVQRDLHLNWPNPIGGVRWGFSLIIFLLLSLGLFSLWLPFFFICGFFGTELFSDCFIRTILYWLCPIQLTCLGCVKLPYLAFAYPWGGPGQFK